MTQENKQLLLKDLCARLPYGVVCRYNAIVPLLGEVLNYGPLQEIRRKGEYFTVNGADCLYEDIKPYLRPMSSMTEEEKEYIKNRWCYNDWDIDGPSSLWREKIDVEDAEGIIDYFNKHYLDYRGLIPMGLALEATEGMYKTE